MLTARFRSTFKDRGYEWADLAALGHAKWGSTESQRSTIGPYPCGDLHTPETAPAISYVKPRSCYVNIIHLHTPDKDSDVSVSVFH